MKIFAYIDPGTGSVVLQAIIGLVVGAAFIIRKQIGAVFHVLKRPFTKPAKEDQD